MAPKPNTDPSTPQGISLVGGATLPAEAKGKFIVRNNTPLAGVFIVDGAEYDIDPKTYQIVDKKPSAMSHGLVCQEV